jgi:DNA-binding response OmpR family regulator
MNPRILLSEDDDAVRDMLRTALERDGFEVVVVASVLEALYHIAREKFDVLLSDLHMPHAGDGFIVVNAMRHTQPKAITLVLSGYPDLDEELATSGLQADEVLVKPIAIAALREIIHKKLANPGPPRPLPTKSVAAIPEHDLDATIQDSPEYFGVSCVTPVRLEHIIVRASGEGLLVQRCFHFAYELRRKEWFFQNVSAHFTQFRKFVSKTSDKQELHLWASRTNLLCRLKTVEPGHNDITHRKVYCAVVLLAQVECLCTIGGRKDGKPNSFERPLEKVA